MSEAQDVDVEGMGCLCGLVAGLVICAAILLSEVTAIRKALERAYPAPEEPTPH